MAIELPASFTLGKLLRLQGMVNAAAATEAVSASAGALVRAYMGLREELLISLESDESFELREEFERLFPPLDDPGDLSPLSPNDQVHFSAVAEEGRTRLAQLGGWIHGLLEELTFEERMRLDAEARARAQAKPGTGFGGPTST